MMFLKPKKKKNTALKVIAVIAGIAAAAAAGYVLYTKVIKPMLAKKKAQCDDCCDCDCECDEIIEIIDCEDETEAEEILSEEA